MILLDGRIPSADPQGEVYRHLVLAACHFYHALLPDVFERLDDETELLLPDDLAHGAIGRRRASAPRSPMRTAPRSRCWAGSTSSTSRRRRIR